MRFAPHRKSGLAAFVALALLPTAFSQDLQGTYKPAGKGPGAAWSISNHFALIWDSSPYLPIGLNVDPTPAAIHAAKAAGIHDVLVDLPASEDNWDSALPALESDGLHYLIRISSLTPMARGIAVDPAAYRLMDVAGKSRVSATMPGATSSLVVVADKRDGNVLEWSKQTISDGRLECPLKYPLTDDMVVLLYPETVSLAEPDFWEGMDAHRDQLLTTLRRHPLGPGLRGIVNPIGHVLTLPGKELRFLPDSPAFRAEFAVFLENRYRNVVSALRAWSLGSDVISEAESEDDKNAIRTFQDLTAFVPLWSGTRGVGQIWDEKRNVLYTCDKGRSAFWKDLSEAVSAAEARRYSRMVSAIRSVVDVPVIQDWAGWAAPYESSDPTVDGIGMRAAGTSPSAILATAAKSTSSMLRWPTPGWMPATEVDLDGTDAATQVPGVINDLQDLGARGVFFHASNPAIVKAIAAEASRRAGDSQAAQMGVEAVFFPENATNPAEAQRLPGGKWWLPSPADGARIDFGQGFFGYRMSDRGGTTTALWTTSPQRVLLHLANPAKATVVASDGSDPKPKVTKLGIEADLGQFPLIVSGVEEIPVPDPPYQRTSAQIGGLLKEADDRHIGFEEGTMALTDAYKAFDRNPGGTFSTMRQLMHELAFALGDYTWAQAQRTQDTDFSEVLKLPGCSSGGALALRSAVESSQSFFADYVLPVRSTKDQELWISARIPKDQRDEVSVRIGSQTFQITDEPIGDYGAGFGWYHLGVTRLLGEEAKLKITVSGASPDLALDAILLAPSGFKPDGASFPEPEVTYVSKKKGGDKKGGKG